ncbi:MAG TPA: hypothetical protein VJ741_22410, partial [Solirubrobacteraceae bacterium]|nr:hypothetical protein [Solirubrobacteraceae bacterium]
MTGAARAFRRPQQMARPVEPLREFKGLLPQHLRASKIAVVVRRRARQLRNDEPLGIGPGRHLRCPSAEGQFTLVVADIRRQRASLKQQLENQRRLLGRLNPLQQRAEGVGQRTR